MTNQEFLDAINGKGKYEKKAIFKGTGFPGKQSYQQVHRDSKEEIEPGKFGKQLAEFAKNIEHKNVLFNGSKTEIKEYMKKEGNR